MSLLFIRMHRGNENGVVALRKRVRRDKQIWIQSGSLWTAILPFHFYSIDKQTIKTKVFERNIVKFCIFFLKTIL